MAHQQPTTGQSVDAIAKKRSKAIELIIILGATTAIGPLAIDMYLPAFNHMAEDFQTSVEQVQMTLSIFLVGLGVGQMIWGPLSDQVGRRLPLILGTVGFGLTAAMAAMSTTLVSLILWRLAMGLMGAAGIVVVRAVVRDLFDEVQSARAYTAMMLVVGVAPVLAPALGSVMLLYGQWTLIFWFMVLFAILLVGVIGVRLPESLPKARRQKGDIKTLFRNYGQVLTVKQFWVYTGVGSLSTGMLFTYVTSSADIFMNIYGLSEGQFSIFFSSCAVGLFLFSQTNQLWLNRYRPADVLRGVCLAAAILGVVMLLVVAFKFGGFWGFYSLLFLSMANLGLLMPNAVAVAMAPFEQNAGSASAMMGLIRHIFAALGGLLVSVWHSSTAMPVAVSFAICSIGCFLLCLIPLTGRVLASQDASCNPPPDIME